MDRLGPLLRGLLQQRGLTRREFGRLVGLSHTSVNRILLGKIAPRPKHAATWCKALGLTAIEARRLTLAICLAASPPVVRTYVAQLERRQSR